MKQFLNTLILVSLACSLSAARYYVAPDASGETGDSWQNTISIYDALDLATAGDEIWILEGTYLSSQTANREDQLVIPSGVAVYGGFSGTEETLEERLPEEHVSVLSGDLGIIDDQTDNAFTVVYILDGDQNTVLDGFTIASGQAKARSRERSISTSGGALVIQSIDTASSPKIQNCLFENNKARYGGAVYIDGRLAAATPEFVNCTFQQNEASFKGGGLYNDGQGGQANPILTACTFEKNKSSYGAGIVNDGTDGESNPLIVATKFEANISLVTGAAIYNLQGATGMATPVVQDCSYIDNDSELGEDIADSDQVVMQVRNNTSPYSRGARLQPTTPRVNNSRD